MIKQINLNPSWKRNLLFFAIGLVISVCAGFALKIFWQPLSLYYINYHSQAHGIKINQLDWHTHHGKTMLVNTGTGSIYSDKQKIIFKFYEMKMELNRHWLLGPSAELIDIKKIIVQTSSATKKGSNPTADYDFSPLTSHISEPNTDQQTTSTNNQISIARILGGKNLQGISTVKDWLDKLLNLTPNTNLKVSNLIIQEKNIASKSPTVNCKCSLHQTISENGQGTQLLEGKIEFIDEYFDVTLTNKLTSTEINLSKTHPEQPSFWLKLTPTDNPEKPLSIPEKSFYFAGKATIGPGFISDLEIYELDGKLKFSPISKNSKKFRLNSASARLTYIGKNTSSQPSTGYTSKVYLNAQFANDMLSLKAEDSFQLYLDDKIVSQFFNLNKRRKASVGLKSKYYQLEINGEGFSWLSNQSKQWLLTTNSETSWRWGDSQEDTPELIWISNSLNLGTMNDQKAITRPQVSLKLLGKIDTIKNKSGFSQQPFVITWQNDSSQPKLAISFPNLGMEGKVTTDVVFQANTNRTKPIKVLYRSDRLSTEALGQLAFKEKPDRLTVLKMYEFESWQQLLSAIPEAPAPLSIQEYKKIYEMSWEKVDFPPFGEIRLNSSVQESSYKNQFKALNFSLLGSKGTNTSIEVSGTSVLSNALKSLKSSQNTLRIPFKIHRFTINHHNATLNLNEPIAVTPKKHSGRLTLEQVPLNFFFQQLGIDEINASGYLYGLINFETKGKQLVLKRNYLNSANTKGIIRLPNKREAKKSDHNNSPQGNVDEYHYQKFNAEISSQDSQNISITVNFETEDQQIKLVKEKLHNPISTGYQQAIQSLNDIIFLGY